MNEDVSNPKVSVIVPCYNGAKIISGCIDSLLKQTYKNFEILFVDDASTDNSYDFVKNKYKNIKKIRFFRNKINKGYAYTINYGYTISSCRLICSSNVDLIFDKNWLKELVKTITKDEKIGVVSSIRKRIKETILKKKSFYLQTLNHATIFEKIENTPKLIKTIYAGGIFCADKKRLARKGIKKPFDDSYFAYSEDDYLGLLTNYSELDVCLNLDSVYWGTDGYTKKICPKFRPKAAFHGLKNIFTNYFIFYDGITLIKLTPYLISLFIASFFKSPQYILSRFKTYFWLLSNIGFIIKKRREIKKIKRVKDNDILASFFSYKIYDDKEINAIFKPIIMLLNFMCFCYTKLVNIKTIDN